MSVKVTERSFYPLIINLLRDLATTHTIEISGISEVSIPGRTFPDILIKIDGYKILVQVKIGIPERLIEDIVKTYSPARSLGADLVGISFPDEVRHIPPEELERVFPKLLVTRGLILTSWQSQDTGNVTLSNLLESILRAYVEYKRTLTPVVDYLTVAKIARETVEELAVILRKYVGVERYRNAVSAIVGRFDYYRAMLEDFLSEDEMKIYMADITAYLLTLQLLFLHIISKRIYRTDIIPRIDNPLEVPKDLIEQLIKAFKDSNIIKDYYKVIGALPPILEILREIANQDQRISLSLAKYIYVLQPLRPENIKEELFGRIYQLGLPPETRKNLGAFFTKPEAAKLLASLAIERWDEKILDPACGSGTLLAESYQVKAKLAKEQTPLSLKNLIEDLVGIDIMHFARELTSINLALQNPSIKVNPKVFMGDGIEKMVFAENIANNEDDPPMKIPIYSFFEELRTEYEALVLPREGFDIVIMNPPFTRRERIPERERERLDQLLGDIVKGKVGYSLYFFAAADNVIKPGGKLAAVTPEEFFAGGSAESVRKFLFSKYVLKYVIRSAAEIAFSEGARYRDYLAIFNKQKNLDNNKDVMVFVILRKRLSELNLEKVIEQILKFSNSNELKLLNDDITAWKIHNISHFISKHINNLKPLVGLSNIKAQELIMELLEDLSRNPTLKEYEDKKVISLRDYTCQYTILGAEEYIRKLFISRYGGRGKISFIYFGEDAGNLFLCIRNDRKHPHIKIDKSSCVYSLRSPAKVIHMDVTDEEEYAIIDVKSIPNDVLRMAGLVNKQKVKDAAKDIKKAYEDLAGNILLVRRSRVTSPNIFWLAFFSQRRIIGPSAPMICLRTDNLGMENSKLLTLYLNSTITLLQLLGFAVETEGAWIAFQGDRVWSNIHLPNFNELSEDIRNEALKIFNQVSKLEVDNLYQRIRERNSVQRSIDLISLKMLGLDDIWATRLDEIYDSVLGELDTMQRILEESSKKSGSKRKNEEETKRKREKQETLNKFFKE